MVQQPPHRDFSTDPRRLALLSALAAVIGVVAALLAKLLLAAIGAITNVAYFHRLDFSLTQPDPHVTGPIAIAIPVIGGIIVGCVARFGTDKVRGHGIPEAIQSILERGSIVQARVAFWKPIASAVAIGTGSPFGAEGPIIMTGGAFGSLCAQYVRLSALERRTLLVAGAAGGMAATFGAPIASVLIAVELLLFEWRPRSFVPVAIAAMVAQMMRGVLLGTTPPFAVLAPHDPSASALPWAALVGIAGGALSMLMTKLVYATEELYERLPIHWMWWPALGALVVGIGGWFVPQALGVGYPTISALVNGRLLPAAVLTIVVAKAVMWITSLSSGTSGGVLAPLLMIGASMGALFGLVLPGHDAPLWAVVGMAAVMGGTMRAPFMGTAFALETTHAWAFAPDVFLACIAATAFTVVFVPRSILTEKLARRGMHITREYAVHPLELISVEEIMTPPAAGVARPPHAIHLRDRVRSAADLMASGGVASLAVVDEDERWVGTIESGDLLRAWREGMQAERARRRVRRFRSLVRIVSGTARTRALKSP